MTTLSGMSQRKKLLISGLIAWSISLLSSLNIYLLSMDGDWSRFEVGVVFTAFLTSVVSGLKDLLAFLAESPRTVAERPEVVTQGVPAPRPTDDPYDLDDTYAGFAQTYNWKWSDSSKRRMEGVHSDVIKLLTTALRYSPYDAGIAYLGGVRTLEQQLELLQQGGKTTIKNSRHLHGLALDVLMYDENGNYTYEPRYYMEFEKAVAHASQLTGIPYRWGGTFTTIKDYAHFELPRSQYPDRADVELVAA